MLLKDFDELWGIPLEGIRKQGKKYKIYSTCVYVVDILMILFCGAYMFTTGSSYSAYIFATVFITLLNFMILNIVINPEKWRAYLFYKKYKRYKVIEMTLYLHYDNMKSILYCSNYKRKKINASELDYKELMLSACREDLVFSKRLGKLLSKFTVQEEDMLEVKTYMLEKGKKYYLIGFNYEEIKETSEEV